MAKYYDYANIFRFDLAIKLSKISEINEYAIELRDNT